MTPTEVANDPRIKNLISVWLDRPEAVIDSGALPDMIREIGLGEEWCASRIGYRLLAAAIMDSGGVRGAKARQWIRRQAAQYVGGCVPITLIDGSRFLSLMKSSAKLPKNCGRRTWKSEVERDRDENGKLEKITHRVVCGVIRLVVAYRLGFRYDMVA